MGLLLTPVRKNDQKIQIHQREKIYFTPINFSSATRGLWST